MLSSIALIAASVVVSAMGEDPRAHDEAIHETVLSTLSAWQGEEDRSPAELGRRLIALGGPAEPCLCTLLEQRQENSAPIEPVAFALSEIGESSRAAEVLADLARAESTIHRACAAESLGRLGLLEGLPALVACLDDEVAEVRAAAATGVLALRERSPDHDVVAVLEEAQGSLQHPDHFALLLGRIGTPEARRLLRGFLSKWEDEDFLLAGLSGLWIAEHPDDAAPVHELLSLSYSPVIRRKACLVLGRLRYRPATRDLIDLLSQGERGLASDAHWALRRITGLRLRADPELWETWWERLGAGSDRRPAGRANR